MKTNLDTKTEMALDSKTSMSEELEIFLCNLFHQVELDLRKREIKRHRKSLGCKVDSDLHAKVRDCAWRNKESVSSLLIRFIKNGLEKELATIKQQ